MKLTKVPTARAPKGHALTRVTAALLGLTLTAALVYTPAGSKSAPRPEKVSDAWGTLPDRDPAQPPRQLAPGTYAVTPAAGPLDPAPYYCENLTKKGAPLTLVTFTFTKPLPKGAWLGKLRTEYEDNTASEREMQLFAPKTLPEGTEWSYQTTDGRVRCKLTIYKGRKELRFDNCNNRTEQYCLAQSLTKLTADNIPGCERCASLPWWQQAPCYFECTGVVVDDVLERLPDCSGVLGRLKCWAIDLLIWFAKRGGPDARAKLELEELYRNWVNFVNRSHGFGRGNSCEGRGYLCPVGTQCIGGSCKIIKKN